MFVYTFKSLNKNLSLKLENKEYSKEELETYLERVLTIADLTFKEKLN